MKLVSIALLTISLCCATSVYATKPASKEQCKAIFNKVERLNDLRRNGGKASQMNKWKNRRDKLSNKAYKGKCRRFGILR